MALLMVSLWWQDQRLGWTWLALAANGRHDRHALCGGQLRCCAAN